MEKALPLNSVLAVILWIGIIGTAFNIIPSIGDINYEPCSWGPGVCPLIHIPYPTF